MQPGPMQKPAFVLWGRLLQTQICLGLVSTSSPLLKTFVPLSIPRCGLHLLCSSNASSWSPVCKAILRACKSLQYRTVVCTLKVYVTWLGTNDCGLAAFSVNSRCVLAIVFDCQALVQTCSVLSWPRRFRVTAFGGGIILGRELYRLSEVRMCQVRRGAGGISP